MPMIETDTLRLAVYRLLVDGKEIGHPMNPTRAAKEVGRAPATIAKHYLPYLLSNGYIRRKKGCINPVLYERGPRAYELDALISRANVDATKGVVQGANVPSGAAGAVEEVRTVTAYIPTGQDHADGRYIFPVLKVGDYLRPLRERGRQGCARRKVGR